MQTRPKTFTAVRPFSFGAYRFDAGDEVTGPPLRFALRYGTQFVTSTKPPKPNDTGDE